MELWKGSLTGFAKGWVKVFSVAVALFSVLTLHVERYCPCDMPEPVIGADFVIRCTVCKDEIKICIHHDSLPDAPPLARCPECGGWWRDNANSSAQGTVTLCGCAMPSPARRDGSIRCTVCGGVIRSCRHHSAHPPSRYPLTRCSDCKGWWNDNGCCRCAQPEMTRQNGRLMCGRCRYWIRLCSCPDGKRPQIGGENEKCPVCGGWREKAPESGDETDTADDTPESGDETGPKDDPPGNKPSEYVPTPKKKPQPPRAIIGRRRRTGFPFGMNFSNGCIRGPTGFISSNIFSQAIIWSARIRPI